MKTKVKRTSNAKSTKGKAVPKVRLSKGKVTVRQPRGGVNQ